MFNDDYVSFIGTFDVQEASAKLADEGGSMISMTGRFIINSRAPGCFLVLQGDYGSPDEFRVIPRNTSVHIVNANIHVPPSTYKVYVYDVEKGGHINNMPAYMQFEKINLTSDTPSKLLKYMY